MREITNAEDIINSRDVIERIQELETAEYSGRWSDEEGAALDDDEREELEALKALADEASGYSDWLHGSRLIRDSYFTRYAEELADDIGARATWPLNYIDWEAAADALKQDYTSVEFNGVTYWVG